MPRRYKHGTGRTQQAMLPPRVEAYVERDDSEDAIDALVETLDLHPLGCQNAAVISHPASLRLIRRRY